MFKATLKDIKLSKNGIVINLVDVELNDEQLINLKKLVNNQIIGVIDAAVEQMEINFEIPEGVDPEDLK